MYQSVIDQSFQHPKCTWYDGYAKLLSENPNRRTYFVVFINIRYAIIISLSLLCHHYIKPFGKVNHNVSPFVIQVTGLVRQQYICDWHVTTMLSSMSYYKWLRHYGHFTNSGYSNYSTFDQTYENVTKIIRNCMYVCIVLDNTNILR